MFARSVLYTVLLLWSVSLSPAHLWAQTGLSELDTAYGDLDGDGIGEKVTVYSTTRDTDAGKTREVHVFKKNGEDWEPWQQIQGGVLASEADGQSGDPFAGVEVRRGTIVILHLGGDKDKWSYTHQFKLTNDQWELVAVNINFGALCDTFTNIDFNLSSGEIHYKKEADNCDEKGVNELLVERKELILLETLPSMTGFVPGDYSLKIPGTDIEFYF